MLGNEPIEDAEQNLRLERSRRSTTLTFPWWFKVIGYGLSMAICVMSISFILMRGIQFGEKIVYEWLTSLVLTLVASILLAQPVQVGETEKSRARGELQIRSRFAFQGHFGRSFLHFHLQIQPGR